MNTVKLDQTGGFPLETETLVHMQDAYGIFQAFGDIVGAKSIIKGCVVTGGNVGDGVIYLNGELLPFVGGAVQTTVVVIETSTDGEFEDGLLKPIYYTRYATFGVGVGSVNWADFVRAYPLTSALFVDEVRMYSGIVANIPWGWYLMDGQNGTRDIRDKFPIPYNPANVDYDAIGKAGGLKEVTLTEAQMPAHNHSATIYSGGSHTHRLQDGLGAGETNPLTTNTGISGNNALGGWISPTNLLEAAGGHTHTININSKGGGTAHENRPPFVALGFIQFKGI
jgi:microcystin-dependent protein